MQYLQNLLAQGSFWRNIKFNDSSVVQQFGKPNSFSFQTKIRVALEVILDLDAFVFSNQTGGLLRDQTIQNTGFPGKTIFMIFS